MWSTPFGLVRRWSGLPHPRRPGHLLSLGDLGWEDCGVGGPDYRIVNSNPAVDLCEIHGYSPGIGPRHRN